ncbi:hypothetical protein CEP52_003381 [Fusarium oligoseptatum]|uniref:NAD(P)-binding protein n=1 Tax=Fusarium oligoseptatum TaxID=2604345 RepID=A0A428U9A5_9HYPO|nr:hypothetical protein CEP52_003381 [Fusarium oligoseptatum]
MAPLIWLITGATSGIGASLIEQVVARGDKVIASGRNVEKRLGHLKSDNIALLELDITATLVELRKKIETAWKIFGKIDVLMNNAGMSTMSSAEEADDAITNTVFEVNFFGHIRVTQAILPLFRAQGSGCIAFTSSGSAWTPFPFMSLYAASKAAMSTWVDALHKEVRPLGIRCVSFELGGFPTNLGQPREPSDTGFGANGPAIEAYTPLFTSLVTTFATNPEVHMPNDVKKGANAIVDVVKGEGLAAGKTWAVRVALGSDGLGLARQRCEEQLKLIGDWEDLSSSTDREGVDGSVTNKERFEFTTILE